MALPRRWLICRFRSRPAKRAVVVLAVAFLSVIPAGNLLFVEGRPTSLYTIHSHML
jgi:hypothetical protein